ncbi:hypothetical protein M413DRAFT_18016 [Hebeloma cylindrosporum]|uniref:Uncharacterized protein n=1 Tax=Hebeloma cylindrosporum TaxID=76867 RepID=A0A0C3CIK4_HEBCY|nr:hypothetical protein M413DRAFT_18016 [Hebeloma cylindrosporum h7]
MAQLNLDVVCEIVKQVHPSDVQTLSGLALLCSSANHTARSILFARVRWPHENRHDPQSGLHFFPESLWPYFKSFHLDWPDHWPDASPPLFGTKPLGRGVYYPKYLSKLESALPSMCSISMFQITAPFYPPTPLLGSLVQCRNIKDLRITDTPLYTLILPNLPVGFALERITLIPVGEALRVGEGPFDKRFHDVTYYTREYRKRHWNDAHGRYVGLRYLLQLGTPMFLRYIQISGNFCSLGDFVEVDTWPVLETLVLTGPAPEKTTNASLAVIVNRMPRLVDLRVLLSGKPTEQPFSLISGYHLAMEDAAPTVFSQLKNLAVSNVVKLDDILHYTTSLERLAVIAIINQPRIPIAISRSELDKVILDLEEGGSGKTLKQIKVMMEDELDVPLFVNLGRACPALEEVEIELCGYRNGDVGFEWTDYGDVFSTYAHLRSLRIGIPFATSITEPEDPPHFAAHHHHQPNGPSPNTTITKIHPPPFSVHPVDTTDRLALATYLASRIPTLEHIGFEYRCRTAFVRYEDRWVDWEIERRPLVTGVYDGDAADHDSLGPNDGVTTHGNNLDWDEDVKMWKLQETWYVFPEVWKREELFGS